MILMAYVKQWFPLVPAFDEFTFTWEWFSDAIYHPRIEGDFFAAGDPAH